MPRLPATPTPEFPDWQRHPELWASLITTESIPFVNGTQRGACYLRIVACDPGALIKRVSAGVWNNQGKAAPTWKSWRGHDGTKPAFYTQNWDGGDWLPSGTVSLFIEYAAPAIPGVTFGGLSYSLDYAR